MPQELTQEQSITEQITDQSPTDATAPEEAGSIEGDSTGEPGELEHPTEG